MSKALGAFLLLCVVFMAGFMVRGQSEFLESLGFSFNAVDVDRNPGATVSGDTYDSIGARVEEVEGILNNYSLDTYDLGLLTQNVLNAFTDSVSDPYLSYFDQARYEAFLGEAANSAAGIGVLFAEKDGVAYAADVFEGSAAQAAGVQQGDVVIAVDGNRSHPWTSTEVTSFLLQSEGSPVVITWRRSQVTDGDRNPEYSTTVMCSSYSVKNVEARMVETTGVIALHQIGQGSPELVRKAVIDLTAQGATSFVLDIRNNPGGYLTQAVDIANLFLRSGTVVNIESNQGQESPRMVSDEVVTDAPLAVLVNGNTGAAAEVLAAALQDNQRAQLVGTRTLGKGSVQVVRNLSFGGALRYTAAVYKSPLGHDIDGVGVTPDVEVGLADDTDNQLQVALEAVRFQQGE